MVFLSRCYTHTHIYTYVCKMYETEDFFLLFLGETKVLYYCWIWNAIPVYDMTEMTLPNKINLHFKDLFFFFFFFWWEHFKDLLRAEPVAKFQPQRSNNTFHPQSYRLVHVFHLWHDFVAYYCTRHRHFIFFSRNLLHILLTTLQIIYSLFSPSYKKVISELLIYVTLLALEIKDLSGDFSPKVNEF